MFDVTSLIKKVYSSVVPERGDLEKLLSLKTKEEMDELFVFADKLRKDYCGDGVALRGIVEFSNFCARRCFYCGLNSDNRELKRYRMNKDELSSPLIYFFPAG